MPLVNGPIRPISCGGFCPDCKRWADTAGVDGALFLRESDEFIHRKCLDVRREIYDAAYLLLLLYPLLLKPSLSDEREIERRQPLSPRRRATVFERDNFTCQRCGARAPDVRLHADHIVPFAHGGNSLDANLQTLCEECNIGKGCREPTEHDLQRQKSRINAAS